MKPCYPCPVPSGLLCKIVEIVDVPSPISVQSEPSALCSLWVCLWTSPAMLSSVVSACLDEKCKGHGKFVLHGGRARFRLLQSGPGASGNKEGRLWAGNLL